MLAEFKIGFADHTVATAIIIRLKTDTTVIDKTVGCQLFQNFVKLFFVSIIVFIYICCIMFGGNLSISLYIYYSNYYFYCIYIRFEKWQPHH